MYNFIMVMQKLQTSEETTKNDTFHSGILVQVMTIYYYVQSPVNPRTIYKLWTKYVY